MFSRLASRFLFVESVGNDMGEYITVDVNLMAKAIADTTGIDKDTVLKVLEAEDSYLESLGIVENTECLD